jgi:glycerophosphoryl diester phosphodiesterase
MKDQQTRIPQIGGHRGLPLEYPDNTLEGIVAAAAVSDFVELDVRRSIDGSMVLSHDLALGNLAVIEHSWDELSSVDLGRGFRPALLDEVLDRLPTTPLDIEIKNSPLQPGFDPEGSFAVEVAARARAIDVVTCFFWPTMEVISRAHPRLRTGLLLDGRVSVEDAVSFAVAGGHEVIAPHFSLLMDAAGSAIAAAHDAGLEIVTWTVNDVRIARQLADAGVDAIISDDPARIRQEWI